MSSEREAYRDLSLSREELFEERYRKAADALGRVEAELKSRCEDQAALNISTTLQERRHALTASAAERLDADRKQEILGGYIIMAFAAGVVTVPAIVGLIALIRAIF